MNVSAQQGLVCVGRGVGPRPASAWPASSTGGELRRQHHERRESRVVRRSLPPRRPATSGGECGQRGAEVSLRSSVGRFV
jgi:hypothetical protein